MTPKIFATACIASAMVLSGANSALAQSLCGEREAVIDMLDTRYGETAQSVGLAGADRIVEVFASEQTGSWTILVTNAAGVTCLVASGQNYQRIDAVAGEPL